MLNSLLAEALPVFESISGVKLNFIGKFIRLIIEGVGSVGLGVILFTLMLKLLVTPFDAWSRVSMRKNSLKMEQMRPQLEKLQKQYANDKQMYSQKMMQLYKKEGYSMFGSCLPTIISLVLFMIVLTQFNTYSRYKNLDNFEKMTEAYTAVTTDETGYVYKEQIREEIKDENGDPVLDEAGNPTYTVKDQYFADADKLLLEGLISEENLAEGQTIEDAAREYVLGLARTAAKEKYYALRQDFLWIKNIWVADTAWSHPILSYKNFSSNIGSKVNVPEQRYTEVTYDLAKEKKQPNGFFVLVVLSIGISLLSQWVMTKGQKAQLELQSVDGTGAKTQKTMMIVMPIMIGFFALMYTSAFSLYMVVNSLFTLLSTLLINKLVEVRFKKKAEKEFQEKYSPKYAYQEPKKKGKGANRSEKKDEGVFLDRNTLRDARKDKEEKRPPRGK